MKKFIAAFFGYVMFFNLILCIPVGMWTQYNLTTLSMLYKFHMPAIPLAAYIVASFFLGRYLVPINIIVWLCLYFHWL